MRGHVYELYERVSVQNMTISLCLAASYYSAGMIYDWESLTLTTSSEQNLQRHHSRYAIFFTTRAHTHAHMHTYPLFLFRMVFQHTGFENDWVKVQNVNFNLMVCTSISGAPLLIHCLTSVSISDRLLAAQLFLVPLCVFSSWTGEIEIWIIVNKVCTLFRQDEKQLYLFQWKKYHFNKWNIISSVLCCA